MQQHPSKFIIEGLDRLGKSTLIEGIRNALGYHEVIHFGRPARLTFYEENHLDNPIFAYQKDGFKNLMDLLNSPAKLIFDRAHLGEDVYAPIYRKYSGDYVFDLEKAYDVSSLSDVRLILLTEDFSKSGHFVDDGLSLGSEDMRMAEQRLFLNAYDKSVIADKRIICVTDQVTGGWKDKMLILEEALR